MKKLLNAAKNLAREAKYNNRFVERFFMEWREFMNPSSVSVKEIKLVKAKRSQLQEPRINLIIPRINTEQAYGGISTAIEFFMRLSESFNDIRLIAYIPPSPKSLQRFHDFKFIPLGVDSDEKKQIISLDYIVEDFLPVGSQDIFVSTYWTTAYLAQRLIQWQSQEFAQANKSMVYFIQDFEPSFYPWSSEYLATCSTYEYKDLIAVFNTELLRQYFHQQGYSFQHEFSFEPRISKVLYDLRKDSYKKKKQILIYGRPIVSRNAFGLIIDGLRVWKDQYPDASQWTILSAGEAHKDINIGDNLVVQSVGKLNLEGYAQLLNESAIGVSLMVSPHPSYPPLEMSHFGMYVITNSFCNKDISSCHENIFSLKNCTPENIADNLIKCCQKIEIDSTSGWSGKSNLTSYFSDVSAFNFIDNISNLLKA